MQVTLVCTLSNQTGRVARVLAAASGHDADLEGAIDRWWTEFQLYRDRAFWVFFSSVPLFFVSNASMVLLLVRPRAAGFAAVSLFCAGALLVMRDISAVNGLFRDRILARLRKPSAGATRDLGRAD